MNKPTAKDITDSYRRLKAKPRDKIRNKFIESIVWQLLCGCQDKKNN